MNYSSQGKQLCMDDFKSSLEGLGLFDRLVKIVAIYTSDIKWRD